MNPRLRTSLRGICIAILVSACLSGCATNGFEKYYKPMPGSETIATNPRFEPPPAQPKVYAHSSDTNADAARLAEQGYVLIGTSSFYGPSKKVSESQAIAQGKKVGAALILLRSQYKDTLSGVRQFAVPNPPQVTTVNTTGTVNSGGSGTTTSYSGGGYQNGSFTYDGSGTYNGTSTITSPGGTTTYQIPYNISRNDYFASYWVKQDVRAMRLGANYIALPDNVRQQLRRNTGVYVTAVIQGTPAFNANILRGDVILKVNDQDVSDPAAFGTLLTQFGGQPVSLSLVRANQPVTINVALKPNFQAQ
jgi:hypothetical protein